MLFGSRVSSGQVLSSGSGSDILGIFSPGSGIFAQGGDGRAPAIFQNPLADYCTGNILSARFLELRIGEVRGKIFRSGIESMYLDAKCQVVLEVGIDESKNSICYLRL